MDTVTVADVARAVLAEVAPEQLDRFPLVVDAYRRSPGAAGRAHRGGDRPTATGPVVAGEAMSALTIMIGVDLAQALTADRSGGGWFRRLVRRHATPDTVVPPVAEPDVKALQARAEAFCLKRGRTPAEAAMLSSAFVAALPRSTKG